MAAVMSMSTKKVAKMDFLHPSHNEPVQVLLTMAGVYMPVYAGSIRAKGWRVPAHVRDDDLVNVPAMGDRAIENLYDATPEFGNPLADEDPERMCLVISPPIKGFRYDLAVNGIPVLVDDLIDVDGDEDLEEFKNDVVGAKDGYLPPGFVDAAKHVQDMSLSVLYEAAMGAPIEILGARLNPLSSGLANIVMFVKFTRSPCPFGSQQMYLPIPETNMKVRIVGQPIIVKNSETKFYHAEVRVKAVECNTQELFHDMYPFASNITGMLGLKLKHVRTDKVTGELVIQGHGLVKPDIEEKSARIKKHVMGLLKSKYMVLGVTVEEVEF